MAKAPTKRFQCPRHWTLTQRIDHHTDRSGGPDACWPWTGTRHFKGYGKIKWRNRLQSAHRLVWIKANGPIQPDKPHILHKCDVPSCVNPDHLWAGTNADNVADRDAKGRLGDRKGSANGRAKLTEADVRAIRKAAGTQCEIAARFSIGRTAVSDIRSGKTWVHLL
jgi:hypothetical protein